MKQSSDQTHSLVWLRAWAGRVAEDGAGEVVAAAEDGEEGG